MVNTYIIIMVVMVTKEKPDIEHEHLPVLKKPVMR